ncbi:MAG: sugar ABC transporter substrate-binding protein [Bradyrhizobium sp.]|nr:MAG: sugar ABC transporter substrate-binding protein [Bradyrhizobium sp.]
MTSRDEQPGNGNRRNFLKSAAYGTVAIGAGLTGPEVLSSSIGQARAATDKNLKMSFIQFLPHTVPAAWSKGIEDVLLKQGNIEYQLLDGQAKIEVQISLMDTQINDGVNVIFLQPVDSVAIGPSIAKARRAGIPVITLNIDAVEDHAAHVEMSHYAGAMDIAKAMGAALGGKGKVAIINAPPGIVIRDQRTNGFVDGLKKYHPNIQIVADQPADWDRKKAQEVFTTILAAHPDVAGAFGVNDSMALGVVDVARDKGLLGKLVVFGDDGEKDALESIEKGELTGTQYTDVYQQGRFAAAAATVIASGGVDASSFHSKGHLLIPYIIATKETVGQIQPNQRW